ncbi:uncharacterized protein METZ01_LOCUS80195 [marine metagenome]|uniref:Uncharacterized protein n=1 Tax=marine metagenome TaxID=408172 RepID=A0A381UI25_9ZZZZ
MINLELLVTVFARAVFGLFAAIALSTVIWSFFWVSFSPSPEELASFFLLQTLVVGIPAGLAVIFAWWNTQSPQRIQVMFIALALFASVISAWGTNELRGVETHYALANGVLRVPVFSVRHMLASMLFGAVLGGNLVAGVFFLYRSLKYREN